MNRYGVTFVLYLVLWLILALTPAFCALFWDGGYGEFWAGLIR